MTAGALALSPNAVWLLSNGPSVCHGTTRDGWLDNGVPVTGGGVARPYCWVCTRALRTYGFDRAVEAVDLAYGNMGTAHPQTAWVYGESGFPWGGRFRPHRTHRNGLSFDLMVPLADGASLPANPTNRFGYDEHFDADGRGRAGRIDFAAMADHLAALDQSTRGKGGRIARVIFAPDLQDDLFSAPGSGEIRHLTFSTRPSWVRHDNHYHVDFDFPCQSG